MNNSHWSKFNGSKKITSESGAALVIALMVLFVVAGLSFAYIALTTNSLVRVDRQERNMVASALAEAGLDYVMDQEKSLPGGFISKSYDLNSVLSGLMSGATGSATITPISGSMAKIRATAVYRNESESVEIVAQTSSAGPWEAAIFAGVGQSGGGINGNVKVAGSVVILGDGESYTDTNGNGVRDAGEPYVDIDADGAYDPPLTSSDTAMALGGNAGIQNNYSGMPVELSSRIPALGTVTYGGETVQSLNAKVHIKRGGVSLSGTGTIGSENQTGNTIKETVDGVYVTDGVTGSGVNSDNGSSNPYDLADDATFPYLSDPYTDTATGISYATYQAYINANSLLISDNIDGDADSKIVISSETDDFSASNAFGSISWDKSEGLLTIDGIVRMNVDLDLGKKNNTVTYTGNGTLFSDGDVRVHSDLLSRSTFPTVDSLGVMTSKIMYLATGGGESQVNMTGAFYAQNKVVSTKQNEIAGSFVAGYFDLGSNVPKIYQVPALSQYLPGGLPKGTTSTTITTLSWRRLGS